MQREFDLVYATPNGLPVRFDFFRPNASAPLPLVFCIHGGGWISGEKEGMHDVAEMLANQGFAAVCPQYRLAPLHPFPAAVEDIYACVTFVRSEASRFGVDPERFATLGNSAGGHLSAMAGLSEYADSRVQVVVDICGISDLTDPHGQHFPISLGFLEQFMGGPYAEMEELYRLASPLHKVRAGVPPFLLIHGDADDVVPAGQSEALAAALREAGGEAELHILPNEGHSFTWDGWLKIEGLMTGFLKKHLQQPSQAAV